MTYINIRSVLRTLTGISIGLLVYFAHYEYKSVYELRNFRTSEDPLRRGLMVETPSTLGLRELHISGSARPTREGLRYALSKIQMPVYIFDVFAEKQYYIHGLPESWYGYKRRDEVGVNHKTTSFRELAHRLAFTGKLQHDVSDAQSPKEMVEELGFHHVRFDHTRKMIPTPKQVDEFIARVDALPNPVWVHFHCSAGKGRTTMAMIMYDILKNGKQVPLNDIVARHYLIGSENLFDTNVWPNGRYNKEMLEKRKDFLKKFYEYATSPQGYGVISFSQWNSAKS